MSKTRFWSVVVLILGWSLVYAANYVGIVEVRGKDEEVVLDPGTVVNTNDHRVTEANTSALYANSGTLTLNGGKLITDKVESIGAATADNGGTINLTNVEIETYNTSGNSQTGLFALDSGKINFNKGTITTKGYTSHGVHALSGGVIDVHNSEIRTTGDAASGLYVGQGGTVNLYNTDIITSGTEGYGLFSIYAANITMNGGTIQTSGSTASSLTPAVYARIGSKIELNNVAITSTGNGGVGIVSRDNGTQVIMNGGTINTIGNNAYGAYAFAGGSRITLTNAGITTTGANAHGLLVANGSTGELHGGTIKVDGSKGSNAVYTNDTGTVTGAGIYNITGDIVNRNNRSISLDFQEASRFKGGTNIGSGNIDFIMSKDSVWTMDKSSTLTNLQLNGGTVDFKTESDKYGTLTTDNLSGTSGLFSMRTDIVGDGSGRNNKGDLLIVNNDSAGNHFVIVQDTGSARTDGSETLTIIKTTDGIGEFALKNDAEIGAWIYGLRRTEADDTDWELYATGERSNPGDNSVGTLNTVYLLNFIENQTLLQRMGELRPRADASWDTWARYYGGELNAFSGQGVSGSGVQYHGVQLGADRAIHSGVNHTAYFGVLGGLTRANANFRVGKGTTKSYYGGLYGAFKHDNGFYVDAVAKYFFMDNDFNTASAGGGSVHGKGDSRGYSASLEVGKRFRFCDTTLPRENPKGWFIEPQGQLTYSRFNNSTISTSHGLKTRLNGFNSLIGRAGGLVGYSTTLADTHPIDLYAKANYLKEFKADTAYLYNNVSGGTYNFKGHWVEISAGINLRYKEKHNFYLDVVYAKGNKFNQRQVNIGYRLEF